MCLRESVQYLLEVYDVFVLEFHTFSPIQTVAGLLVATDTKVPYGLQNIFKR